MSEPPGPGDATVASELDDALYYLRHDCVPCAERHFAVARSLGATDDMIAQIRSDAQVRTYHGLGGRESV